MPSPPRSSALQSAYKTLQYSHESASSFLDIYFEATSARGPGAPTHEDQDLLRAAIVFVGAGVDACLKQSIKDALEDAIAAFPEAQDGFCKFVERRLKGESQIAIARELSETLVSLRPREHLLKKYQRSLTGSSLQSLGEIQKIFEVFGCNKLSKSHEAEIKKALEIRNKIIHELDMDFESPNRNRTSRRWRDIILACEALQKVAIELIKSIDGRIVESLK
ncbi:MAG: hypothetical protein AAFX79_06960 [Planctomycetota bacterium]